MVWIGIIWFVGIRGIVIKRKTMNWGEHKNIEKNISPPLWIVKNKFENGLFLHIFNIYELQQMPDPSSSVQ